MDVLVTVIGAGAAGTLVMDLLNNLFARTGIISKIDVALIGRMAAGWLRGRFLYEHPDEIKRVSYEKRYGYIAHYIIGIGLASIFLFGWYLLDGGPVSPLWAILWGIATTSASVFFIYPSMGYGVFGMKSPEGIKGPISSLANHFFFGIGMAIAIAAA